MEVSGNVTTSATNHERKRKRKAKLSVQNLPESHRLLNRIKARLSFLRYSDTFHDAYNQDGWKGASRRKLKPTQELEKIIVHAVRAKKDIKCCLRLLDPAAPSMKECEAARRVPSAALTDADGVDMENVVCFACGGAEPMPGNDILLCDFAFCGRAYHQQCHVPPVKTFPAEDEDWTCAQCSAYSDGLEVVNGYLGGSQRHTSWETAFPELNASDVVGTADGDDSEEDSDFAPGESDLASSESDSCSASSSDSVECTAIKDPSMQVGSHASVLQLLLDRGSPPPHREITRRAVDGKGKSSGAAKENGNSDGASGIHEVSLADWYHGNWTDTNDGDDDEYQPAARRRKRSTVNALSVADPVQEGAVEGNFIGLGSSVDNGGSEQMKDVAPLESATVESSSGRARRSAATRAMDWFATLPAEGM